MQRLGTYLSAALLILSFVLMYAWRGKVLMLMTLIAGHTLVSYVSFVLLLIIAVVFMPVTVMPVIPLAAMIMGPFTTGVLSVIGWTLGALIAFVLARHIGRPILKQYVSLRKVDDLVGALPAEIRFFLIILLRLTTPVDIVSYALGFTSGISIAEYGVATLLGVVWFSFAFAYMGDALLTNNIPLLVSIAGVSLVVFIVASYLLLKTHRKRA